MRAHRNPGAAALTSWSPADDPHTPPAPHAQTLEKAIDYAIAIMGSHRDVAAPVHAIAIQRHMDALAALRARAMEEPEGGAAYRAGIPARVEQGRQQMTTWIDRFTKMQPLDVLMTINEDVSTLIAFLNEVRDLRNPPGDERDMSAMQAARAVVDEAADEVLTLRAKLRNCEDQYKASANSRRLTNELQQNERIRELRAELESALDRNSALRDNEAILLRQLSDALTGGNASTWDDVLHAATVRAESTADLREAAGALDGFADRAVNPDAAPRLRELAQACRRASPAAPEGETPRAVTLRTAINAIGFTLGRINQLARNMRISREEAAARIGRHIEGLLTDLEQLPAALATPPAPPAPAVECTCEPCPQNPHCPTHGWFVAGCDKCQAGQPHWRHAPSGPPAPVATGGRCPVHPDRGPLCDLCGVASDEGRR